MTEAQGSGLAQRILAGLVALPLTAYALLVASEQARSGLDALGASLGSLTATLAVLCWWFVLRGHVAESRAQIRGAVIGGLLVGGVGFVAGCQDMLAEGTVASA